MKKKLLVLSLLAALTATIASGTVAYYTSVGRAHNVITTGGVEVEIVEKMKNEDGTEEDFPEEGIKGVMPGIAVSKIVTIANTGEDTAWIRASLKQTIEDEDGNPLQLELRIDKGDGSGEKVIPVMEIEINTEKWMVGEDGYYYYKEPLERGKVSDILFEKVLFAKELGDDYQGCKANVIVSVEAVQFDNNPIPDGGDVTDIKGWPETEGGV